MKFVQSLSEIQGKIMDANLQSNKYILSNSLTLDAAELIPIDLNQRIVPQSISINTLGKYLLKAAGEGDVDEIKNLMTKGATFTADWLGTSPLHLAALNNHLEICEILLRAGICKDSRTKVDRTPLHMAAYEGHIEIVECLLKNNADYDCRDLLGMTPLHWAAQNGHAEIAAMLVTYGATTNIANKFSLTPIDIAYQIGRTDIIEIITLGRKNPLIATEHLQLEMSGNENSTDTDTLSIKIESVQNSNLGSQTSCPEDVVHLEDEDDNSIEDSFDTVTNDDAEKNDSLSKDFVESNQHSHSPSFSESMKILQQHGITMLPADENNILSSVMETGHSVVLTDIGREVLNSVKAMENVEVNAAYNDEAVALPKSNKIITLTQEEFIAMANGSRKNDNDNAFMKQLSAKLLSGNQAQAKSPVKRIVMKKNKIIPISSTINSNRIRKGETFMDLESLLKQLADARKLVEIYKQKYIKKEAEAEHYKQQLKQLLSQKL